MRVRIQGPLSHEPCVQNIEPGTIFSASLSAFSEPQVYLKMAGRQSVLKLQTFKTHELSDEVALRNYTELGRLVIDRSS